LPSGDCCENWRGAGGQKDRLQVFWYPKSNGVCHFFSKNKAGLAVFCSNWGKIIFCIGDGAPRK
jgi:hypothetical protein